MSGLFFGRFSHDVSSFAWVNCKAKGRLGLCKADDVMQLLSCAVSGSRTDEFRALEYGFVIYIVKL